MPFMREPANASSGRKLNITSVMDHPRTNAMMMPARNVLAYVTVCAALEPMPSCTDMVSSASRDATSPVACVSWYPWSCRSMAEKYASRSTRICRSDDRIARELDRYCAINSAAPMMIMLRAAMFTASLAEPDVSLMPSNREPKRRENEGMPTPAIIAVVREMVISSASCLSA